MSGKTASLLLLGLSFKNHHIFWDINFQDFIGTLKIFNHDCPHFIQAIMIENLLCAYEIPQIVVIYFKKFMMPPGKYILIYSHPTSKSTMKVFKCTNAFLKKI